MIEGTGAGDHPFLATVAVRRTGATTELPGRYCAQQDVWVIDGRNGPTPIVTSHLEDSVAPLTKVKGERDAFCSPVILELSTKTHTQLERDDVSPRSASLSPELVMNADKMQEREEIPPRLLLELATKTEAVPERDDR